MGKYFHLASSPFVCVRFPDNFNGGQTNYSHLTLEYAIRREMDQYRAYEVANEQDITIYNKTK